MKMKKILASLLAVASVASLSVSAFADVINNDNYNETDNTISIKTLLNTDAYAGKQMTVIIVKEQEEGVVPTTISDDDLILYIDQAEANTTANIFQDMGIKGSTKLDNGKYLADGTYYIKIGSEDINDGIIVEKFTVTTSSNPEEPKTITFEKWGDINADNAVDTLDINSIVKLLLGTAMTYGDYTVNTVIPGTTIKYGDINLDNAVDTLDINSIVKLLLGTAMTYGDYTVNQPATIIINE